MQKRIEELTYQEAEEMGYIDTPLQFTGYYKYAFGFRGIASDGGEISVDGLGGDKDDIYRADIQATMTLKQLHSELGVYSDYGKPITVTFK